MRAGHCDDWKAVSINLNIFRLLNPHFLDSSVHKSFKFKYFLSEGPAIDPDGAFAGSRDHEPLYGADQQRRDMAVHYGELGYQVLALVLVQHHVLLSSATHEQVRVCFFSALCYWLLSFFLVAQDGA